MINNLTTILDYLKRNMNGEPSEQCLKDHIDDYELRFQNERKGFNFSLYCPHCSNHYYDIWIDKNYW